MDQCQCQCDCGGLLPPTFVANAQIIGLLSASFSCVTVACGMCWWCCIQQRRFRNITDRVIAGTASCYQTNRFREMVRDNMVLWVIANMRQKSLRKNNHTQEAERLRAELDEVAGTKSALPQPAREGGAETRHSEPLSQSLQPIRTSRSAILATGNERETESPRLRERNLGGNRRTRLTRDQLEAAGSSKITPGTATAITNDIETGCNPDALARTAASKSKDSQGSALKGASSRQSDKPRAAAEHGIVKSNPTTTIQSAEAARRGTASPKRQVELSRREALAAESGTKANLANTAFSSRQQTLSRADSGSPSARLQRSSPSFYSAHSSQTG